MSFSQIIMGVDMLCRIRVRVCA